jgi:hypothetical protein
MGERRGDLIPVFLIIESGTLFSICVAPSGTGCAEQNCVIMRHHMAAFFTVGLLDMLACFQRNEFLRIAYWHGNSCVNKL